MPAQGGHPAVNYLSRQRPQRKYNGQDTFNHTLLVHICWRCCGSNTISKSECRRDVVGYYYIPVYLAGWFSQRYGYATSHNATCRSTWMVIPPGFSYATFVR